MVCRKAGIVPELYRLEGPELRPGVAQSACRRKGDGLQRQRLDCAKKKQSGNKNELWYDILLHTRYLVYDIYESFEAPWKGKEKKDAKEHLTRGGKEGEKEYARKRKSRKNKGENVRMRP